MKQIPILDGRKRKKVINIPRIIFDSILSEIVECDLAIQQKSYALGEIKFNLLTLPDYENDGLFWGLNSNLLSDVELRPKFKLYLISAERLKNNIFKNWTSNYYYPDGIVKKRSNREYKIIRDIHSDSWIVVNYLQNIGIVIFDSLAKITDWYSASPLRIPLAIFANKVGINLLHGGVVEKKGKATLFLGDGGSGKSSKVLDLILNENYNFISDDYFALNTFSMTLYPIYNSIKLNDDMYEKYKNKIDKSEVKKKDKPEKRIIDIRKLGVKYSEGGLLEKIVLPSEVKFKSDLIKQKDVYRAVIPSTMIGLLNQETISVKTFLYLGQFKNMEWLNWREQ